MLARPCVLLRKRLTPFRTHFSSLRMRDMWSLSLADTLHSSKAETNIITWENDEQMNEVRIAKYLFVLYFTWGPHLLIFLLEILKFCYDHRFVKFVYISKLLYFQWKATHLLRPRIGHFRPYFTFATRPC